MFSGLTKNCIINNTTDIVSGIHLLILILENIYFFPNINDTINNPIVIAKYAIIDNTPVTLIPPLKASITILKEMKVIFKLYIFIIYNLIIIIYIFRFTVKF